MGGEYAAEWVAGQPGVGLVVSDTMMFERGAPEPGDPDLSSFYGLALPLVVHGVPPAMVQAERITRPGYLDEVRVLVLSWEGQKPLSSDVHASIAAWVRGGGALVLFGTGDAYDGVREWWNESGMNYARPREHLCELLGLGRDPEAGEHACGGGFVVVDPASPAALACDPSGADIVMDRVRAAFRRIRLSCHEENALVLRHGPYLVAAGTEEAPAGTPVVLRGAFVDDLFDSRLAIRRNPVIAPGSRWLLYDLARCPDHPWVIAAAGARARRGARCAVAPVRCRGDARDALRRAGACTGSPDDRHLFRCPG